MERNKPLFFLVVAIIIILAYPASASHVIPTGVLKYENSTDTTSGGNADYALVSSVTLRENIIGNISINSTVVHAYIGGNSFFQLRKNGVYISGTNNFSTSSPFCCTFDNQSVYVSAVAGDTLELWAYSTGFSNCCYRVLDLSVSYSYLPWANMSYKYRSIADIADGARAYQIPINVTNATGINNATHMFTDGNCMQTNCSDIPFYLNNITNTIPLPYWVQSNITNTAFGIVWANVTQNGTISMYFGNSSSNTYNDQLNGKTTFPLFDTFNGSVLDSSLWFPTSLNAGGTISLANSEMTITAAGAGNAKSIKSNKNFTPPYRFGSRTSPTAQSSNYWGMWTTADSSNPTTDTNLVSIFRGTATTIDCVQNNGVPAGSASTTCSQVNLSDYATYLIKRNNTGYQNFYKNSTLVDSSHTKFSTVATGIQISAFQTTGFKTDWVFIANFTDINEPNINAWSGTETLQYNNYTNNVSNSISIPEGVTARFETNMSNPSWYIDGTLQSASAGVLHMDHTMATETNISAISDEGMITWTNTPAVVLIYPVSITINSPYPPIASDVTFRWYGNTNCCNYELIVAEDASFNIIDVDTTLSSNFSTQTIQGGKTYHWKVIDVTNNITSAVQTFTIASTSPTTSGGIQGVVYQLLNGQVIPISGATVYLYNNSYTTTMTVGSNGYYLFPNLVNNSVYSIYATQPSFNTPAIALVTSGNGSAAIYNIQMTVLTSPYVTPYVYEKFILKNIFGTPYAGVLITIYDGTTLNVVASGFTSTDGMATFQLFKDHLYTVNYTGGGFPTYQETIYGSVEDHYPVLTTGFPTTLNQEEFISWNFSISHDTPAYNFTLTYNDTATSTILLTYWVFNASNNSYACYQTGTGLGNNTFVCSIPARSGESYIWGFNASSSLFGFIDPVKFTIIGGFDTANRLIKTAPPGHAEIPILIMNIISIALILYSAMIFDVRNQGKGAVIVGLEMLFWAWIGWLSISIVVVIGGITFIMFRYFKRAEQKVG